MSKLCGFCRFGVKRKVFKDLEFYKRMEMAKNCVVTVKEVAELFWNNQIAIDVDNDYGIVCFDKPSLDLSSPLLEQLIQVKAREAVDDTFLRAHFRYSLLVNIVGGGVFDDFTSKERGIWQEGIGKLVGQWVMNESLVKRLAEI
ncbi:hypothetical protein CPB84DRAFT_1397371 [Gymnopilus junonius]|uniref:Uncharacterized protein n=1 Tax=Gymnopilus junonius TaxID=109634 RepID=A0A9P5NK96_GYMJU|nr:hypothetical protein CPB84DRAFT_1397371 [Gymnopilus junonius]